jgi:hypothetical protein
MTAAITIFAASLEEEVRTNNQTATVIVGIGLLYLLINGFVAGYGHGKGYPFFPLFVASLFLGFPLVLLVITIAAGPSTPRY